MGSSRVCFDAAARRNRPFEPHRLIDTPDRPAADIELGGLPINLGPLTGRRFQHRIQTAPIIGRGGSTWTLRASARRRLRLRLSRRRRLARPGNELDQRSSTIFSSLSASL